MTSMPSLLGLRLSSRFVPVRLTRLSRHLLMAWRTPASSPALSPYPGTRAPSELIPLPRAPRNRSPVPTFRTISLISGTTCVEVRHDRALIELESFLGAHLLACSLLKQHVARKLSFEGVGGERAPGQCGG